MEVQEGCHEGVPLVCQPEVGEQDWHERRGQDTALQTITNFMGVVIELKTLLLAM